MRILQLSKKFPYPLKDGESIAITTLSRALNELGCEVSLLAMNTTKHYYDAREVPEALSHYRHIRTEKVDNRIKAWDAFRNLFSRESYHVSRFVSPGFREQLIRLLRESEFEIIQLETLYLAPYIPTIRQYSDAVISMRAHNVEHEIWERIARNSRSAPLKWYLKHLASKLRRYEIEQLRNYDILIPISDRDLSTFRELGRPSMALVTPIGINPENYKPDYGSFQRELSLSFIGSLDWMPNQEGLRWFLERVWPALSRDYPWLKLHVAGRNTPEWLFRNRQKNVVVHGEVADAASFISSHSLMVVPLLSGSGMRAKILEGMALGKVILTTSLGLEGISCRQGEEVFIADTPETFDRIIRQCIQHPEKLEFMGRRARDFVLQHYNSTQIARRLLDAYSMLTVEVL